MYLSQKDVRKTYSVFVLNVKSVTTGPLRATIYLQVAFWGQT